jgi:hypothetical protein
MKNTRLKKIASVVMTAAIVLTPVVALAAPGPAGRPTLTYGPDFKGADHVQFNSIVNSPTHGDERAFFSGRDASLPTGSAYSDPITNMQAGKEYKLQVYIHNNANDNLNQNGKGVAEGVKVSVVLPGETNSNPAVATISTTTKTATPMAVTDTLDFKSNSKLKLSYVPGSAYIKTNKLNRVPLSDSVVNGGVTVGSEALDGKWLGCFAHDGFVYLNVKVTAPETPVTPPVTPPTTPVTPTLPETGMGGAAAAALGLTAIGTSAQAYLRSKRGLVKAQRNTNR